MWPRATSSAATWPRGRRSALRRGPTWNRVCWCAGFVLDGFPRNLHQAQALEAMLARQGRRLSGVIALVVREPVLLARLTGRRVCQRCGATYHVQFQPPRVEGVCDVCGGPLLQRPDDRPETVERRLAVYAEETRPLEAFYRERGLLRTVDGEGTVDAVTERIARVLSGGGHD
jgi:adenylate kinase